VGQASRFMKARTKPKKFDIFGTTLSKDRDQGSKNGIVRRTGRRRVSSPEQMRKYGNDDT